MQARRIRAKDLLVAAVLAGVVAIAAGIHLGRASLWLDEAFSWSISGHGLSGLLHAYAGDGDGAAFVAPLHFLLLDGWLEAFGTSEAALRSLSLVFAVAAIPVFLALCLTVLRRRAVACVTTALLAVSPFLLDYAREARMYSLTLLLVIGSSYGFVRTVQAPRSRWWLTFGLVAGLAMYAHFFAALVLLSQVVSLAFLPRPVQWRPIARGVLVAMVLAAPLALYLVAKTGGDTLNWVPALSQEQVRTFLQTLTGASRRASVVVVFLVGLAGVLVLARAWKRERARLWYVGFPLVWFVVPIMATAAISVVKPLFVDRYLIVVLPGFLLTIGVVLDSLEGRRSWLVPVAAGLLVVVSYPGFDRVWGPGDEWENWRQAVAYLDSHYEAGDEIVVGPNAFAPTAYYALRSPQLRHAHPVDPPRAWDDPITRHRRRAVELADRPVWIVVRAYDDLGQPGWETAARERFRRESAHDPRLHRVYETKAVSIYRFDPP
jgi:uncharacterized membrane protein